MNRKIALSILLLTLLAGCESKDWEAAGYQDGRAATINTTLRLWPCAICARMGSQTMGLMVFVIVVVLSNTIDGNAHIFSRWVESAVA